jgi:hypothetical protein
MLTVLLMTGLCSLILADTLGLSNSESIFEEDCPKLEENLMNLATVADPVEYAASVGLAYTIDTQGREWVRVVIELTEARSTLPQGYSLQVEMRHEYLVQALVLVSKLCALSNEPEINYVRAPRTPHLDQNDIRPKNRRSLN